MRFVDSRASATPSQKGHPGFWLLNLPNFICSKSLHVRKYTGCLDLLDSAFMRVMTHPPFGFEFGSVVSPESGRSIGCSQTNINWSAFVNNDFLNFFPSLFVFDRELQRNNSVLHSPNKNSGYNIAKKERYTHCLQTKVTGANKRNASRQVASRRGRALSS